MNTIKVNKTDLTDIRNLLMGQPFHAEERSINYGVQYSLESGIKCNIHSSDKKPDILSITVQNTDKDLEQFKVLEFHLLSFAI